MDESSLGTAQRAEPVAIESAAVKQPIDADAPDKRSRRLHSAMAEGFEPTLTVQAGP
ncbi:MAG: hypothetical protein GX855_07495 [Firmicutes bacterium]|nr:hypothetical protein [Bacillota bacterium]